MNSYTVVSIQSTLTQLVIGLLLGRLVAIVSEKVYLDFLFNEMLSQIRVNNSLGLGKLVRTLFASNLIWLLTLSLFGTCCSIVLACRGPSSILYVPGYKLQFTIRWAHGTQSIISVFDFDFDFDSDLAFLRVPQSK